jgi:hypothetical protein
MNIANKQSVTLCGEVFNGPLHVCAFFDSRDSQYEVLVPWLKEGLENNESAVNILSSELHEDHCERLKKGGIAVKESVSRNQLKVVATEESYLYGGSFAAERMFKIVEDAAIESRKGPYGGLRACGEMEWALKNLPGTDELMEYEARLNMLTPNHDCSIVCCYDINRFSGNAIADILATHPHVIMNGKIHKNPHYIEPVEFLGSLMKRPRRPLSNSVQVS